MAFLLLSRNESINHNSGVETIGLLGCASRPEAETIGSLANLYNDGGLDGFGGKDAFGTFDESNFASGEYCAMGSVETIGSLAADFGSFSSGFASFGGDAGASCSNDCGSFTSVC